MSLHPRSSNVDVDGLPVHVVDHGGPSDGPTIVCVHGLAGSHANWRDLATHLTAQARVVAVDLPGHGRTPRLGRSSAVQANRVVLDRLLQDVVGEPVALIGHSMGATLAILQAAARPESVTATTLIAPPMPRTGAELPSRLMATQVALCAWPWLAHRTLSRRLRRLGAERFIDFALQRSCASPQAIDPTTRDLLIELVETQAAGNDAHAAFVQAARSVGLLVARAAAYRRAVAAVRCPTLLVHGESDRLLRPDTLNQLTALQPEWRVHVLDGVGHSPHMESPRMTSALILDHLTRASAGSSTRASAPSAGFAVNSGPRVHPSPRSLVSPGSELGRAAAADASDLIGVAPGGGLNVTPVDVREAHES